MTDSFPPPLPFACRKVRSGFPSAERDVEGADHTPEKAFIAAHLAECPSCRQECDTLRHLEKTLQALPEVAAPDDLMERIMAGVEQAEAPVARLGVVVPFRKKLASVAAAITLLALGGFFLAERLTGERGANEIAAYRSVEATPLNQSFNQSLNHGTSPEAAMTVSQRIVTPTAVSTNIPVNDSEDTTMVRSIASADRAPALDSLTSPAQPEALNSDRQGESPETVVVSSAVQREAAASSTGQAATGALLAESSELAVVPPGEVYNDPVSSLVGF